MSLDLLDAAIGEVTEHRHSPPGDRGEPGDDVPDPFVFDPQTLGDLHDFLRDARRGLLPADEVAQEAQMWQQLVDVAWPHPRAGDSPVEQAVAMLATGPGAAASPALAPVEPANELEEALAAVVRDEATRPALWQALHDGEVVLPVVPIDLARAEGVNLQFLSAPTGDSPLVLGFATEERYNALLPEGSEVSRVLAPGRDLPRIWPTGHGLMLNAGYENGVVLSPGEVTGLPHGGRSELPHPRSVTIVAPSDGDEDRAVLLTAAAATVPGCEELAWACVRRRGVPDHAPWRDVLVVTATTSADDQAVVVQALEAALPVTVFPNAVVVGRDADLVHPLVEAVVAAGRTVRPL